MGFPVVPQQKLTKFVDSTPLSKFGGQIRLSPRVMEINKVEHCVRWRWGGQDKHLFSKERSERASSMEYTHVISLRKLRSFTYSRQENCFGLYRPRENPVRRRFSEPFFHPFHQMRLLSSKVRRKRVWSSQIPDESAHTAALWTTRFDTWKSANQRPFLAANERKIWVGAIFFHELSIWGGLIAYRLSILGFNFVDSFLSFKVRCGNCE